MILPYLSEVQKSASKKYSVLFRGINYGEATQDGEFAETYNLSTDKYPCITQRAKRIKYDAENSSSKYHKAIYSKAGKLFCITGVSIAGSSERVHATYGGETISDLDFERGKKQIASIGNYIVIFPDKKYYNVSTGECGNMEASYRGSVKFTASTITLTSTSPFREGDAVEISGSTIQANNKSCIIRGVTNDTTLVFDDNAFTEGEPNGNVTITRKVPDLDFVCESNNRLWGTHGNTIYASKFSDPFNFHVFDGLSSDSYAIDLGSEGEFTGCIPYSSHICFFKENTLHKLYGTKPSNYQVTTANVFGVQSGSEHSMQIINEQLIYKGVGGVYSYTGGVPELISDKFGNKRYSDAVACSDGEKYYISMRHGDEWNLFAYDVAKNIWMREDNMQVDSMTFHDGKVYYIDAVGSGEDGRSGEIYYIDKTEDRNDIEWGATFCTFHETMNERKGYSKFHLRMDMSAGAWLSVDVKTDMDTKWRQVYTTHNAKAKTVSIPIMPTRCDSIDIRLRGKGECTVKAFIREFTVGSDV